jgi:hypothetical protein
MTLATETTAMKTEEAVEEAVEEEVEEAVEEAVEAAGATTTTMWSETATTAASWEPHPNSFMVIPPTPTDSWTA